MSYPEAICGRQICVLAGVLLFVAVSGARGQSPADLARRGIEAYKSGQLNLAQRIFNELVRQEPSGASYSYLAAVEGARGEYAQAIVHFLKSIRLGNDTANVRYNLALAYLNIHQFNLGIRQLRIAVARDPAFVMARYALGRALLDNGQAHEALTELEQVRGPLSTSSDMWTALARAEFETQNVRKALRTVDEAVATIPGDSHLAVVLAEICLDHQQAQKARELLENASAAEPNNNELKLLLAEASLKAGEPEEALAVLKNVPSGIGGPGQVAFLQGNAFLMSGKLTQAAPLLASAVAAGPQDADYLSSFAELEASERNYTAALTTLEKAQKLRRDDPEFTYRAALVYILRRRYALAVAECQEATRIDAQFDQAYFLIGSIQLDEGDAKMAAQTFSRAVAIKPASALYRCALGAALFKEGRLTASRRQLDQALLLDPYTAASYYWRSQLYVRESDRKLALADLKTFVVLDPDCPEAYEHLSELYTAEGQFRSASAARARYQVLKRKEKEHFPFFLAQLRELRFRQAHARPQ